MHSLTDTHTLWKANADLWWWYCVPIRSSHAHLTGAIFVQLCCCCWLFAVVERNFAMNSNAFLPAAAAAATSFIFDAYAAHIHSTRIPMERLFQLRIAVAIRGRCIISNASKAVYYTHSLPHIHFNSFSFFSIVCGVLSNAYENTKNKTK